MIVRNVKTGPDDESAEIYRMVDDKYLGKICWLGGIKRFTPATTDVLFQAELEDIAAELQRQIDYKNRSDKAYQKVMEHRVEQADKITSNAEHAARQRKIAALSEEDEEEGDFFGRY